MATKKADEPVAEEAVAAPEPRSAQLVSLSNRTTVSITVNDDGSGSLSVDRDGHRWTQVDLPKEQAPIDT